MNYAKFLLDKLPSLMRIAKFSDYDLNAFDGAYAHHNERTAELDVVRTTLFDIAGIYPSGDAKLIVDFGETLGQQIDHLLPESRRPGLKEMIRRFIGTDDDSNGYLTGLGELAVLSELLKMPAISVEAIEPDLPNGKTADFCVLNNCQIQFIEVVTVQFDANRISQDEDVVKFFFDRAKAKLDYKKQGLQPDVKMVLFMVIFGSDDVEQLLKYEKGILELCDQLESIGAFWPFVVGSYLFQGEKWEWQIHTIKNLLSKD